MQDYFHHLVECERFIESFKTSHKELYQNYHQLLEIDLRWSGRVKVREGIGIRPATLLVLNQVLKEFYNPLDN